METRYITPAVREDIKGRTEEIIAAHDWMLKHAGSGESPALYGRIALGKSFLAGIQWQKTRGKGFQFPSIFSDVSDGDLPCKE